MDARQLRDRPCAISPPSSVIPTRRGIYLSMRESPRTRRRPAPIAESFGIHPNVARHHLERARRGGLRRGDRAPREDRPRCGTAAPPLPGHRPRRSRSTTRPAASTSCPNSWCRWSSASIPSGPRPSPRRSGPSSGRELAIETGLVGGQRCRDGRAGGIRSAGDHRIRGGARDHPTDSLLTSHCPFGTTATDHPEIVCRIDQGIVRGLMEAARGDRRAGGRSVPTTGPTTPASPRSDPAVRSRSRHRYPRRRRRPGEHHGARSLQGPQQHRHPAGQAHRLPPGCAPATWATSTGCPTRSRSCSKPCSATTTASWFATRTSRPWPPTTPPRWRRPRSPSSRAGWCSRTSPACPRSSTSPRCAPPSSG